eukprot:CAMPEP_0205905310 /NCGR_PEP_ID=MMETSP1325-20131115/1275_1 /ASSEMBLY_ACC=CAM_ASM_000708 /TAXON_ID=236786 /ORGANISM="Florenciella sp., Strain RCC1007" /LENGTH=60 /DNA_ID=CAMNT_0053271205 /DNA_START=182 /DNA_END=361 /DNA_ORIENTATION=-
MTQREAPLADYEDPSHEFPKELLPANGAARSPGHRHQSVDCSGCVKIVRLRLGGLCVKIV